MDLFADEWGSQGSDGSPGLSKFLLSPTVLAESLGMDLIGCGGTGHAERRKRMEHKSGEGVHLS
jgi:hypothetical protein